MAYLTIGNCVITIEDCPITIGDPCHAACFINYLTSGYDGSGDITLTYDVPANNGINVSVYLYFYVNGTIDSVTSGWISDTTIDNGVDGKLYRYFRDSADNLTGQTVTVNTTPASGGITAMMIATNMTYNDNGVNASGVNVTTLTVSLPSGSSAAATVDGAFTVLAQPFGHTFGGAYWTVDDANAVLLADQEAGGGSGVALSAWVWADSTTVGIPGTITWNSDSGVSRPEIDYLYFLCV